MALRHVAAKPYVTKVPILEDGYDIRTVKELLGHKDVRTTMVYTPVLDQGPMGVRVRADADVTSFHPERILDRSSYETPAVESEGIQFVLVGGVPVVKDGQVQDDDDVLPGGKAHPRVHPIVPLPRFSAAMVPRLPRRDNTDT